MIDVDVAAVCVVLGLSALVINWLSVDTIGKGVVTLLTDECTFEVNIF